MKNFRLLILLLSLPFCNGCNNDDDKPPVQTAKLEGKWNLINIQGGIMGYNHDFEKGLITWTFNESQETIVVVNNNPADLYDALGMGTYHYENTINTATPELCPTTLNVTMDDMIFDYGCQTISGDTLTFSQIEADGYKLTFIR